MPRVRYDFLPTDFTVIESLHNYGANEHLFRLAVYFRTATLFAHHSIFTTCELN